jgi:hypothetical protein
VNISNDHMKKIARLFEDSQDDKIEEVEEDDES